MSEKRYVISELDPISVLDMNTGDTFPIADGIGFVETIVECLNTLHEENKQLQHDATILIQANQDYRKENEQLKQKLEKVYDSLIDENEQLKQKIKDLRIDVLDSIHEADEIQCTCNPCIVEEYVKRVVE